MYLRSTNAVAGEESCAEVALTGELLSNSKATDKARVLSGSTSGCSGVNVGTITTTLAGFPWTIKMKHTGVYAFKGTPRLKWEDVFTPSPGKCNYQAVKALNPGSFAVSTTAQPLVLKIVPPWLIEPVASSPLCGSGELEGTFEVKTEKPHSAILRVVEAAN